MRNKRSVCELLAVPCMTDFSLLHESLLQRLLSLRKVNPLRLQIEISWLLVCLAWLSSFCLHSCKLKMLYRNPIRHNPPEFPFFLFAGDQAISHSHRLQRVPLLILHSRLPCDFMVNVREPEIRLLPPWENQEAKGSRLYRRESIGYIWLDMHQEEIGKWEIQFG